MKKTLIILNSPPYDGSDVIWNALRLASVLQKTNHLTLFLMNDSVDLAREANLKPDSYDVDLTLMLKDLISSGVDVQVCGTCMARCGLYKNHPYFDGANKSTMNKLAELVNSCDTVLTF